jgi:DNA-binding response OmpR family regulator
MRILIVDDEFAALKKLEVLLMRYGKCDAATNGKQAKLMFAEAIKEDKLYGLITIDIGLPDMSGIELLKYFCMLESKNSKLPAKKLMITGSGDLADVLDAGKFCNGYITKPMKREVLREKLKNLGIAL